MKRIGLCLNNAVNWDVAGNRQEKIDMNVLMFVSNPFTNDPRVYAEAKSLVQAGGRVTVVAWDSKQENPPRQTWDGIDIVRVSTRLSPKYGAASWLWNGFNLLLWWWQAYRRALILNKETRFDVIHCHDFDTLAIGIRLKGKLRLPLIYDAHEIYGYMVARSLPRWIANMLLWLEKRLVTKADRIINAWEAQQRYFSRITDRPISIIMNCKPLQSVEYQPADNEGNFTVLYIGVLHKGRAVPMLVQAVKRLPGVHCIIGGIGHPDYVQALKEECSRISNVTFLGRVPLDEVIPMTRKSDCVFLMIDPADLNNSIALANKQFEAMVCGRPIICARGTYSGEVTEQEEVGLTVEYTEEALKQAIIKLRDNSGLREKLGRNALEAAISKYNWQNEEVKLLELYESLKNGSQLSG
jgi:glycosyltransferase involved in cell wall biosynthesis